MIYPNPSNGEVTFIGEDYYYFNVTLYALSGCLMLNREEVSSMRVLALDKGRNKEIGH